MKESKDGLSAAHPNAGICTQAGEDLPSLGGNNIRKKGSSMFQNKFPEGQWDQSLWRRATNTEGGMAYKMSTIILLT